MFSVQRWCFTTCALFILTPRRLVDASSSLNYRRYTAPIPSIKQLSKLSPARWATSVLKNEDSSSSRLENVEPGYDFSGEEMERLRLWPSGVIPYYIDEYSFDKVFRDRIRTFLDATNGITGLNFFELYRPPEDEKSRWAFFINRQGLLSCTDHPYKNFTTEGVQKVVLGYDCLATGGELAEAVLALVGVPPQHNAPDRDDYIKIVEKNIMPEKVYLFQILKNDEWLFHEVDYDFSSATHYPLHKYTMNGMATIQPVSVTKVNIGEGTGFSSIDVWKVRMLYNFISKKRNNSVNIPECNKLFNLSTNISNFETESEDEVQPRKKPNKYLGLPNGVQTPLETPTDDSNSEEYVASDKPSYKNSYEKESTEEELLKKEKANINDNNPEKNYNERSNEILKLSDYAADKTLKLTDRKFTRPGGKQKSF